MRAAFEQKFRRAIRQNAQPPLGQATDDRVQFAVRIEWNLENFRLVLFEAASVGPSFSSRGEERAFRWVADDTIVRAGFFNFGIVADEGAFQQLPKRSPTRNAFQREGFTVNGEIAQDLVFEYNTCFDFHQMCMVESAPHIGSVSNWTLRGNVISANAPTMSGGWGPDIIQTLNVTIANNTISTVRWASIGLRGKESTGTH